MPRGRPSGYSLNTSDARIVLGMVARGDRKHDIAAWFGVNQGRIRQASDGDFGTLQAAPEDQLPPQGPPGIKGRRLRLSASSIIEMLEQGKSDEALGLLKDAINRYDANEQ